MPFKCFLPGGMSAVIYLCCLILTYATPQAPLKPLASSHLIKCGHWFPQETSKVQHHLIRVASSLIETKRERDCRRWKFTLTMKHLRGRRGWNGLMWNTYSEKHPAPYCFRLIDSFQQPKGFTYCCFSDEEWERLNTKASDFTFAFSRKKWGKS